jgi:hypothetical protein
MTGSLQTAVGGPFRACEGWWHERSPWSRSYCTEECWPRPQLLASLAARDSHRDVRWLSTAFTTKGPSTCFRIESGFVLFGAGLPQPAIIQYPTFLPHAASIWLDCIRKRQEGEHDLWASPDWPGGFRRKGCGCGPPAVGRSRMTPPVVSQSGFFPVSPPFVAFDAATPPPHNVLHQIVKYRLGAIGTR